ncbi:macro domain-containing protein [Saccharothrix sp. AJ9571]|nr:macro domain-containing protein [Saccharothrix sp. AJ9571]
MAEIRYLVGDATSPQPAGPSIVAHICNDRGGWGKGFVSAISRRWREPEAAYRRWYRERATNDFGLGAVQFVEVEPETWVANMVGQRGVRTSRSTGPPIRYDAVRQCLGHLATRARDRKASVHMPRIGCGLAGGSWEQIEPLVHGELVDQGIPVTVYDLS